MQSKLKLNSSVYSFDFSSVSSNHLYFVFYLLAPDPIINSSISLFISVDAWLSSLILFVQLPFFILCLKFRYLHSFFSPNNILAISAIFGRFSHHFSFLLSTVWRCLFISSACLYVFFFSYWWHCSISYFIILLFYFYLNAHNWTLLKISRLS